MLRPLFLVVTLAACTGKSTYEVDDGDADNDGFTIEDGDCNDSDPMLHPDALELCDAVDNNCNGIVDEDGWEDAPVWYADTDGDDHGDINQSVSACGQPEGYVSDTLDCDDSDSTVYTGADEVCDGVDNDCDGNIDEGTATDILTWHKDSDGDGYGTPFDTVVACEAPSGYVANGEDCDDFDVSVAPDQPEVCDGLDNDCDGLFDDEDGYITDAPTWYLDDDTDGFGISGTTLIACDAPIGYADNTDDCDDTTTTTNPDADEVCGDGEDNNCDGNIDEESAPEHIDWYIDADADGFGDDTLATVFQCDQPTGYTAHPGDCNDDDATINPQVGEIWYDGIDQNCDGASDYDADADGHDSEGYGGEDCDDVLSNVHPDHVEVCGDGLDNDCDNDTDPCGIDAALYGTATNDFLGSALDSAGDWDGDGYSDLLLGAPGHDGTALDMGGVYVVGGPITGSSDVYTVATVYFYGERSGDSLGTAVAGLGDIDDDGYSDILMGAPGYDGTTGATADAGAAYLHYGPDFGPKSLATSLDVRLTGVAAYDQAGFAVSAAGDFNDDGDLDFIIGAPLNDTAAVDAGAAYLLFGPLNASALLSTADVIFAGTATTEQAGSSVSGGGDINNDGYDDVAIGAPSLSVGGVVVGGVSVVNGTSAPAGAFSLTYADAIIQGVGVGDLTGASVSVGGDTNGDGYDDLLIGAPGGGGTAYLFQGPISGTLSASNADAIFTTTEANAALGTSVDFAGDLNDDGRDDVILGAPGSDLGGYQTGTAYLMLAPVVGSQLVSDADGAVVGQGSGDAAGFAVAGVGDFNLDGYDDVVTGAPFSDANLPDAGTMWLTFGGGF
ncbi:MAG: hypothetical protein ACI8RZ_000178 [Myxococcota bacterium]|jgi:hypothetical protein